MITKSDYPEEDQGVTDPLETRHFYELCQSYRHSSRGGEEFESIKEFIRNNFTPKESP